MRNYIASFISVTLEHCFKYHPGTVVFLKGSYDAISSFGFSLECYKLFMQR